MKILVLGAGAVGGYFGGRLAEGGAEQVRPGYDIVTFTAKAFDLPSAIEAVAPAMAEERGKIRGHVLPLLNGMSHLDLLDERFGRCTDATPVLEIAATHLETYAARGAREAAAKAR